MWRAVGSLARCRAARLSRRRGSSPDEQLRHPAGGDRARLHVLPRERRHPRGQLVTLHNGRFRSRSPEDRTSIRRRAKPSPRTRRTGYARSSRTRTSMPRSVRTRSTAGPCRRCSRASSLTGPRPCRARRGSPVDRGDGSRNAGVRPTRRPRRPWTHELGGGGHRAPHTVRGVGGGSHG